MAVWGYSPWSIVPWSAFPPVLLPPAQTGRLRATIVETFGLVALVVEL